MRLEDAIAWALEAHDGQLYNGDPYILHPLRVMLLVPKRARVAAVLHDVLEDYGLLPSELGATDRAAVELLTRPAGESYEEYILRILDAGGPEGELARMVKLADLTDNLEQTPLHSRLEERYRKALEVLVGVTPPE